MEKNQRLSAMIEKLVQNLRSLEGQAVPYEILLSAIKELNILADRLERPYKPMILALCGPTGAGKSHIFNYLAGEKLSPSSYRRPSTVAPVLGARPDQLPGLDTKNFLSDYQKIIIDRPVVFENKNEANEVEKLYLAPVTKAPWPWPAEMALIDTPDFDSVMAGNQVQALDMARRADAIILVAHQAKYADQSTWDFLELAQKSGRQLLVIFNRVTDQAAVDDFTARLEKADIKAPIIVWPEEAAVGQVNLNMARQALTGWLNDLGQQQPEIMAKNGLALLENLKFLINSEISPALASQAENLEKRLLATRSLIAEWSENPQKRLALNLPRETKAALMKNLNDVVKHSDLWAAPRRFLAKPLARVGQYFKNIFQKPTPNEGHLMSGLEDISREALVAAVRDEARALAETSGQNPPPEGLDLTPDEIRSRHAELTASMDEWLKTETAKLLSGLPLGKKAAFYLVQFTHIGLVLGLQIQTGGLPGTEILVGGALGPLISKLTGVVISREAIADFEEKAIEKHGRELAAIFDEQGRRYEKHLTGPRQTLAAVGDLNAAFEAIEKEIDLWA